MSSRSRLILAAAGLILLATFLSGCAPKKLIVMNMNPIIADMNLSVNR